MIYWISVKLRRYFYLSRNTELFFKGIAIIGYIPVSVQGSDLADTAVCIFEMPYTVIEFAADNKFHRGKPGVLFE